MKNLIIAAAIAVTSVVSFAPASYADTVTVTTHERPMHRGWHHAPRRHCTVKTTKFRHHGRLVVRKTRVCR